MADPAAHGLPHGEPFIFIDEVMETRAGEYARCQVTFGLDRDFFRGHFPGNPVVPGVILTEALAQTAGIAAGSGTGRHGFLLTGIRSMKFRRAVLPGEVIRLEASQLGAMAGLLQFEVTATVGDGVVAAGQIVLVEATERTDG